MALADALPTVNAALNATSAVLAVLGFRAIRAGRRDTHRALAHRAASVPEALALLTSPPPSPIDKWIDTEDL